MIFHAGVIFPDREMLVAILAGAVLCGPAQAQDSIPPRLDTVVIEVGRGIHRSPLELPFAVTVQTPDSLRPGQRHVSLDETLWLIPGLSVSNRNNPSQDPRISIRGFGARSAFGVRGIRVLRDGIPLTLPDGQTPVDFLDLESVGTVEVMRGSASSLYGNAGGGVVDIRTSEPLPVPFSGTLRATRGSFESHRLVARGGGFAGRFSYQGNVSRTEADGYRDYSKQRTSNGFSRLSFGGESGSFALEWMGVNTPIAENPGALTRAQFESDPSQPDPLSVRKRARKAVTQSQLGATARHDLGGGEIQASAYAGTRSLDNPLTFAIVDVGRTISGGNLRATLPLSTLGVEHRFTAGTELQLQNDLRRNFTNCNDQPPLTVPTAACPDLSQERGSVTLDQRELVSSIGSYLRDEIGLGQRYVLTGSARADAVRFEVRDRLVSATNPNDSGRRSLQAVSPMVGLLARITPLHSVYANIATAFETPTATELGNSPTSTGGINRELQPQRSLTYEIGGKGITQGGIQYNAALFSTAVHDELIPFDIPASGGRRYFRNAGRTSRRGVELGGESSLGPIDIGGAYTLANYRFREFVAGGASYAGNRIPGIPEQTLQASVAWRFPFGTLVGEGTAAGRMFVDDANTASSPGYAIANARLVSNLSIGLSSAQLTVGAQNLFGTKYVSSVSVNAAGGKFYEPGSGRSLYVGLMVGATSKKIDAH